MCDVGPWRLIWKLYNEILNFMIDVGVNSRILLTDEVGCVSLRIGTCVLTWSNMSLKVMVCVLVYFEWHWWAHARCEELWLLLFAWDFCGGLMMGWVDRMLKWNWFGFQFNIYETKISFLRRRRPNKLIFFPESLFLQIYFVFYTEYLSISSQRPILFHSI
jgi:hypothetical protein